MIGFGSQLEIELDASRFANDDQTRAVAAVVASHAERRRREYRATEQPIKRGLLEIEGYWSDSLPWYEWMSEPHVLKSCAEECGLSILELANVIAYQIQPANWQVFSWMGLALQGREHEETLANSLENFATALEKMRTEQSAKASKAGRASGKARAANVRCTPTEVARQYQLLMSTGTARRNIAGILAARFHVTADHIRRQLRKA